MIHDRYLLVSHIPITRNDQCQRATDELWHRDLIAHMDYIWELVLAAPSESGDVGAVGMAQLEGDERWARLEHVDLPAAPSTAKALLRLPVTIWRLWRQIARAGIVHAHVTGWPIPTAWVAAPIAWWHRRFLLIVVESSPWSAAGAEQASLKDRLRGAVFERLARFIINRADLAVFTHEGYRRRLLTRHPERGHVINASWIDEANILSDEAARDVWREKLARRPLRLLFAGRLLREKGVPVLLDAMRRLTSEQADVEMHIMGVGEQLEACRAAAVELTETTKVVVLPTVPYDQRFFECLRRYDALVVPSISEEQPRIVYDAFSQAVPVLASDTGGLRSVVTDGQTGRIYAAGDANQLADAIKWAIGNRATLMGLGMKGLPVARSLTHSAMHARRHALLLDVLGGRGEHNGKAGADHHAGRCRGC